MYAVNKDQLSRALDAVVRARGSILPVYALAEVQIAGAQMAMTCFNGEFGIQARIAVQPDDPDADAISVSVDAQTLKEVVATLDQAITLSEGKDNKLVLRSSGARAHLKISEEKLPPINKPDARPITTLSGAVLRSLGRALSFASTEEARPVLMSLMLTVEGETINACATDGFSVGWVKEEAEGVGHAGTQILLPASFTRALLAIASPSDKVQIKAAGESRYIFSIKGEGKEVVLTSPSVGGAYPLDQIRQFLQSAKDSGKAKMLAQPNALTAVARQMEALGSKKMYVHTKSGEAHVSSDETAYGTAHNVIVAESIEGEFRFWVATPLVKRVVDAASSAILMSFADSDKPLHFEAGSLQALVMPLRAEGVEETTAEEEAGNTAHAAEVAEPVPAA